MPVLTGDPTYDAALVVGLVLSALTAFAGFFVRTPYGRFAQGSWGPMLPVRWGWLLMEAPAIPVFLAVLLSSGRAGTPLAMAGAAIWLTHYANRSLAFPLLLRVRPDGRMAWVVPLVSWVVVPLHAWLYATWLGRVADPSMLADLATPRFAIGLLLWGSGFALILHTEALLRGLRKDGATGYVIPFGGGYRWVSSPHYLGEIVAFTGMMVAMGCPGGLFVLTITLANLVPRAAATHAWYREQFPDYPNERRALVPLLW